MKTLSFSVPAAIGALVLAIAFSPTPALAQLSVQVGAPAPEFQIQIGGPLVAIGPGIWVLPNSDDEVFFNGGWYWARSHGRWYRSHGRRGGWAVVQDGYVPRPLIGMAPGRYRQFHAPDHARMMPARGWQTGGVVRQPPRMQPQGRPVMQQRQAPMQQQRQAPMQQRQAPMQQPRAPMQQRQAPMQRGGGHEGHGGR